MQETHMEAGATAPGWAEDGIDKPEPITVPEFEKLISELYAQNRKIKSMQEAIDDETKTLTMLKSKVMAYLEEYEKEKYSSNEGTLSVQNKFSVQVPKDPESKGRFFEWLRAKGIFDATITVHSATLNSLYNSMLEESGDPDFEIPGVGKGTHYKILSIRSK